jgi:hypothetical protein
MAVRLEEKNSKVHMLEDENGRLRKALEGKGMEGNGSAYGSSSENSNALQEKVNGFARERSALRTILENKIQSLVVGVGRSVDGLGAEADDNAPRLRREVRALERLVAATVQAMEH